MKRKRTNVSARLELINSPLRSFIIAEQSALSEMSRADPRCIKQFGYTRLAGITKRVPQGPSPQLENEGFTLLRLCSVRCATGRLSKFYRVTGTKGGRS